MQALPEIQKLVFNLGYTEYAAGYTERPARYTLITAPRATVSHPTQGDRAVDVVGMGDLVRRDPGQRYEDDTVLTGYTRQMALFNFGKSFGVPAETVEAAGGMAAFEAKIANFAREVGKGALRKKERMVADMYQKGTLSAGDTAVFNQSFVGNPDTNAGKIYDGKPWFAASGNAHPPYTRAAAGVEGINLVTTSGGGLALSTANLQTHLTNLIKRAGHDERGNPIDIMHPVLMVPPELEFTALQIMNSTQVAESANNAANVIQGRMRVVANPFLTDTASAAAWWTLDPAALQVYDEQVPRIRAWFDNETNTYRVACDIYFGAAPYDWRLAACNNKAAS